MDQSEFINKNFTIKNFNFTLYGASSHHLVYKVTPIVDNPPPDAFYNTIINDNRILFFIELSIGKIVIERMGYININEDESIYHMILELKVVTIADFTDTATLLDGKRIPSTLLKNSISPRQLGNIELPVSININQMNVDSNLFNYRFNVSIMISNVDNVDNIIYSLYNDIIMDIIKEIRPIYGKSGAISIEFETHFVALPSEGAIRLIGFIFPRSLLGIRIKELTETSILIEEDDKWCENNNGTPPIIHIEDIIPRVYNTLNKMYFTRDIVSVTTHNIDGKYYKHIKFNTLILSLENDPTLRLISNDKDIQVVNFYPVIDTDKYKVYKNLNQASPIKYCGYMSTMLEHDLEEFLLSKNILTDSYKIDIIHRDINMSRTMFISCFMVSTVNKNKTIYDIIVDKFRWWKRKKNDI